MLFRFKLNNSFLHCCALRKPCGVWLIAAGILLAGTGCLEAATYYVRTDGNDSNSGTGSDAANAWATVSAATTKSLSAGDVVYVKSGTYTGTVAPSVSGASGNPIKFIADKSGSVSGWPTGDVILQTSSGNLSLDIFNDNYLEFEGFNFEGDVATSSAIELKNCDGIRLERCEISGAGSHGIYTSGASSDVTLLNCLIHNNAGDGVRIFTGNFTVWNTTIADNGSDGIEQDNGTLTLTNSIVASNTNAGLNHDNGTITHTYNLVYGNGTNNYEGTSASIGEISLDPLFVSATDYHIRSTSPSHDAGTSAAGTVDDDFHGNPRPENGNWDMGYHEYGSTDGATPLLLVTANDGYVSTQERHRKTLFEAWDFSVTTVWAGDTQANFDTALATVTVAYVPQEVAPTDVAYKLREATVGVVNDEPCLTDEFGFATLCAGNVSDNVMNVADNSHYITSSFALGSLTLFSSAQDANFLSGTIAPGAQVLGDWSGSGTLAAIDMGATLATTYNSSDVAFGRRVQLPFGSSGFDFSTLTDDGKTLVRRALEWVSPDALVGHWTFDEGAGTTIADASAFGNDASFNTGTPTWISGVRGGALEFDGTNDAITGATFDPPAKGTVAFWFRSDGPPLSRQRLWGTGGDYEMWQDPDGLVSCDVSTDGYQGGFITTSPLYEAGRWYHLTAVYDSADDSYEIYINGQFHKSGVSTWAMDPQPAALLSFGTRTGSTQRFSGALDDFRIYNYQLSAVEIADLYGLVGHWPMDEGIGTTAADSTAYGNDATLSGATWTSDCAGNIGLEFDGATDTATTNADFDPPETGAVAMWLRSAGNPGARSRPFGVGGDWEMRQESDGALSFDLGAEGPDEGAGGDEFVTTEGLSFEDRWYHVIAQFDASDDSFEIYINGALVHSGTNGDDMVKQLADTLTFGTRTGSTENWEGGMRDFRVYNRWLTGSEISDLSGLVAYWKLDETSGTVAVDSSPNGHDGTLTGSPTWTSAGNIDGALDFESSDGADRIDVSPFDISGNQISLTAWIRPEDGVNDGRIVIKSYGNSGSDQFWGLACADTLEPDFRIEAGGTFDRVLYRGAVSPGRWYHIAGTYDGTTMRLYVNGREVNSKAHPVGGALDEDPTATVTLGDSPIGSRAYDGRIDDVHVYKRVLCPEEVFGQYRGGRPAGIRIIKWVEVR